LVRKLAAQTMSFWGGTGEAPAQTAAHVVSELASPGWAGLLSTAASLYPGRTNNIEAALLQLARDNGRGAAKDAIDRERREIRYGAVLGLARHGSPTVKAFLPTLAEMLDFNKQKELCAPHEADAALIVRGALKAVQQLHRTNARLDLSALQPALSTLIEGSNKPLAEEALETRLQLKP
jgi:hypothetical protein